MRFKCHLINLDLFLRYCATLSVRPRPVRNLRGPARSCADVGGPPLPLTEGIEAMHGVPEAGQLRLGGAQRGTNVGAGGAYRWFVAADGSCRAQMGDGMQVWAKTAVRCLFDAYVVESLNNNQIAFELSVENLERALKSAQFSTNCNCKLTKKGGKPYLTFIVEIQAAQIMNVVQDVPVKLLTPAQAALILEPSINADPREVNVCLPSVGKVVRPIVDRLRKLDDVLLVEANMDGVLRLGVQTDR